MVKLIIVFLVVFGLLHIATSLTTKQTKKVAADLFFNGALAILAVVILAVIVEVF